MSGIHSRFRIFLKRLFQGNANNTLDITTNCMKPYVIITTNKRNTRSNFARNEPRLPITTFQKLISNAIMRLKTFVINVWSVIECSYVYWIKWPIIVDVLIFRDFPWHLSETWQIIKENEIDLTGFEGHYKPSCC